MMTPADGGARAVAVVDDTSAADDDGRNLLLGDQQERESSSPPSRSQRRGGMVLAFFSLLLASVIVLADLAWLGNDAENVAVTGLDVFFTDDGVSVHADLTLPDSSSIWDYQLDGLDCEINAGFSDGTVSPLAEIHMALSLIHI